MGIPVFIGIIEHFPNPQRPSGQFQERQTAALRVAGDLENLRAESFLRLYAGGECRQQIQKCLNTVKVQTGAENAGEKPALFNQAGEQCCIRGFSLQEAVHRLLAAKGNLFFKIVCPNAEVYAVLIKTCTQIVHQRRLIRPGKVHLGDKQKRRDPVPFQQPPERLGMRLYPVAAGDHKDRAVKHRKGTLHLRRKVHMSGCVQQGKQCA